MQNMLAHLPHASGAKRTREEEPEDGKSDGRKMRALQTLRAIIDAMGATSDKRYGRHKPQAV